MFPTQLKAVCMRNLSRKSVLVLYPAGLHPVPKALADGGRKRLIWIWTVMLFEPLNFGLWIQTTLETPERCFKGNNRRERWIETASSPEERPPSLSSPAVTALTTSCTSQPCFSLTSALLIGSSSLPPTSFLGVSYTFLFSSCFASEICHCQHRASLCPSKHLLKLSSAITPRKTWEEAPKALLHSPTYNNHWCRCTVFPCSLTSW